MILSSPLLVGSLISCTATPNDGKIDGDTATVDAIVQNTEPSVTSVSIGNGPFYTNDLLTATATLVDDDTEQTVTATYEWHIIDSSDAHTDKIVQTGSDHTLDGVSHFDRDDEVYVIVTPNDGIVDGAFVTSSSITVMNTAPTVASISVSPNPGM